MGHASIQPICRPVGIIWEPVGHLPETDHSSMDVWERGRDVACQPSRGEWWWPAVMSYHG